MDERTKRLTGMWMSAQPIVSSFVSSMVRDFAARDDVMQEVVAAVIESFHKYDPEKPFVGWLLGIARNQVGLYHRKMKREKLVFDESVVSMLEASFGRVPISEVQKLEFLQGCLERLSERDRKLCDLRYERDLKPSGIATIVGMTANNVSKSLQRIRDQLRNCIEFHVAQAAHRT
jgi:RNA polymerase sigma-70 factor (ECF subfamily)